MHSVWFQVNVCWLWEWNDSYLNDLSLVRIHKHLYADDTILYTSGPHLKTALSFLQNSFNNLEHAFYNLYLLLNINKTEWFSVVVFLRPPQPSFSSLDGTALHLVNSYKYLGVWLNSTLTFDIHTYPVHYFQKLNQESA